MLPKSKRFTKEDFVGQRPKVFFRGDLLDIASVKLSSQKFACVISKKTLKRAVDRNLIKRRIFNSVLTISLPKHEISIVFYPKKTMLHSSYTQIKEEITKAFATLQ